MRPAVFLDRDGTIIQQVHHLTDPADIRLLPATGPALRLLRSAGYACVLVTNQSVIGRGMLTVEGLEAIHAEMSRHLSAHGAQLDAIYFCPVAPTTDDRTVVQHPDRKPGPGMLQRAAAEMGLDLTCSWMVGDMLSDVLAGRNAGCRGTILVRTGHGGSLPEDVLEADHYVPDILEAASVILREDSLEAAVVKTQQERQKP